MRQLLGITRALSAIAVLPSVLLLAASCSSDKRSAPERLPNVVLIVIDTLRADHLGCYGYERGTSPRIDAFAEMSTRYTRAISAAPWTVPTHASLFTGKDPFEHGAHTFPVDSPRNNVKPLADHHITLAEVLRAAGYRTGAFISNFAYLSRRFRLNQGFDSYDVRWLYADRQNAKVFNWLDVDDSRPFFLFVNYIDTHRPYNVTPRAGFIEPPAVQDQGELVKQLIQEVMPGDRPAPEALVQRVIDQYDTAVANVDEQVGALLDRLQADGLYDETVIVITSDHGEYFGEHRLVEHSKDVYQEALVVPLLIREPGQRSGRVDDTLAVSGDVPHLILSELPSSEGQSHLEFFPDHPGSHLVIAENYYTREKDLFHPVWGRRFQRVRRAVFDWPFKYIDSSDGAHELFDLEDDPGESRNLITSEPEVARRLARALREHTGSVDDLQSPDIPSLNEEERKRLESLGYLGG